MGAVLVTGGAGYVGSRLVRQLIEAGHDTVVLDNFTYGREGLDGVRDHPRLRLVEGDICDLRDLSLALRGVTRVIALAAIVGDPACALDEGMTRDVNYESTKVLVELCNRAKVERLVFASSCSVYGAHDDLVLNEGSRLHPQSLYAVTRIMSEEVIRARSDRATSPVILRLASLYGWSYRPRFDLAVNILTAKAKLDRRFEIHDARLWRPFLHVADAAAAFMAFATAPDAGVGGETFNVGLDAGNMTIGQLGEHVSKRFPEAERVDRETSADPRNYRVSFDKLHATIPDIALARTVGEGIDELAREVDRPGFDYRDDRHYNVKYLYR